MSENAIELNDYQLTVVRGKKRTTVKLVARVPVGTAPGSLLRLAMPPALPPPAAGVQEHILTFIAANYHKVDGALVLFADFYQALDKWLPADAPEGLRHKQRVIAALNEMGLPYGKFGANRMYIGNISANLEPPSTPYVLAGKTLVLSTNKKRSK